MNALIPPHRKGVVPPIKETTLLRNKGRGGGGCGRWWWWLGLGFGDYLAFCIQNGFGQNKTNPRCIPQEQDKGPPNASLHCYGILVSKNECTLHEALDTHSVPPNGLASHIESPRYDEKVHGKERYRCSSIFNRTPP